MSGAAETARQLLVTASLREPLVRSALETLRLPAGSRGLDAGCGVGLHVPLLAEAVGPSGLVTGLDLSSGLLSHAKQLARKAGIEQRTTFRRGDVRALPFAAGAFDWAWSVDCVGYGPMEPLPLVRELARVVKPGGLVALLAYSSQQLLPGHPRLEARLNATAAGTAPFVEGTRPDRHFLSALGWLRAAGLADTSAHTLVRTLHAPLDRPTRDALAALLDMRWGGALSELAPEDRDEFRRLCHPRSADFILGRADYYAFFTYTLFRGRVTEPRRARGSRRAPARTTRSVSRRRASSRAWGRGR
jgi:demethylmenaquinone methyltransferase/2-methoxy-6-polyprenyl-1,4-benzoquinol methylase